MKLGIRKIVFIALYASLFVILSFFELRIINDNVKITLQNLPLFISAITLGSTCGCMVGFIGSLILQIRSYGFMATTLLWVLPHMIAGYVYGLIFEKGIAKTSNISFYMFTILANLLISVLNTVVDYIQANISGYFTIPTFLFSTGMRFMLSFITGTVYALLIPLILKIIKKIH